MVPQAGRTAIFFFFLLASCFILHAQTVSSPEKIKSVTELTVETRNGKDVETKKSVQLFDEKGNMTEETEYDDDGKVKDHIIYEYDSNRNKTRETHLLADGKIESVTA